MAVINVTTTLDVIDALDGLISLREAIIEANGNADATDTINLVGGDVYTLTIAGDGENASATGDLDINDVLANANITIQGVGGNATIDASGIPDTDRVLDVRNNDATVNLIDLTLTGGEVGGRGGGVRLVNNAALNVTDSIITDNESVNNSGGGIGGRNGNIITITNSEITGNTANDDGGGVYTYASSGMNANPSITIIDSTISGNSAGLAGGGVFSAFNHTIAITDTTISGNTADGEGGGGIYIYNNNQLTIENSTISSNVTNGNAVPFFGAPGGGGIFVFDGDTVDITNSTISGNTAADFGGGAYFGISTVDINHTTIAENEANYGGGISTYTTSLTIGNTIIATNVATTDGADIFDRTGSPIVSNGFNLIGDNTSVEGIFPAGVPNANDDFVGTAMDPIDPGLSPLADNGGPTETHALGDGCSLAINNGDPNFVAPPDFDQRGAGFDRVFGGRIDIGAFELQNSAGVRVFGNNANGTPGDDTIVGDAANNRLSGNFGNDNIFGGDGRDTLLGQSGDDFLGGGLGNDRITGGAGADTIDGACGGTGTGEIDRLTGSGGAESDLFVLGASFGAYYLGNGDADYAYITDFGSGIDKIQLNGVLADYTFMDVTVDNISGRGIFRGGDLIAIVQPGTIDTTPGADLEFV